MKQYQEAIQAIQNEIWSAACLETGQKRRQLSLAYMLLKLAWYILEGNEPGKVKEIFNHVKDNLENQQ